MISAMRKRLGIQIVENSSFLVFKLCRGSNKLEVCNATRNATLKLFA